MKKQHQEFLDEMMEWSLKKDSYEIEDFIAAKGITEEQFRKIANSKTNGLLAVGYTVCQCLHNAYQAWRSQDISGLQFAQRLHKTKLFDGESNEDRFDKKYDFLISIASKWPEIPSSCDISGFIS
jgi:hypothetical protein